MSSLRASPPPLFTSRLLSSRRYNLAIPHLFPSLSHPISLLFSIYPSAYISALPLPPSLRMLAPSLLSIFLRQPFSIGVPTLSKPCWLALLLTREGGFCTHPPPSLPPSLPAGSGTRWRGRGGGYTRTILFRYRIPTFYRLSFRYAENFMVRRGLTAKFFEDRLFYTSPDLFFPFTYQVCLSFETCLKVWENKKQV